MKKTTVQLLAYIVLGSAFALSSLPTQAIFISPSPVPLSRLIANTQKHIEANPVDSGGYYILGRLHYLAFINEVGFASVYQNSDEEDLPSVQNFFLDDPAVGNREGRWSNSVRSIRYVEAKRLILEKEGFATISDAYTSFRALGASNSVEDGFIRERQFQKDVSRKLYELEAQGWEPPRLSEAKLQQHALSARRAFEQAIELENEHSLALLGLASLYEQYLDFVGDKFGRKPVAEMQDVYSYKFRQLYFNAHASAFKNDRLQENIPMRGRRALVSWEAGTAYERHVQALGDRASPKEIESYKKVRKQLATLEAIPPARAITPIVFSLSEHREFSDLIDKSRRVSFDLSGYGQASQWRWVTPGTAFLVYDQNQDGVIESAKEMFGSYSFEIPFTDGYQALSALDNNLDGELAGDELKGIAAWFDYDSNAVSDPGEVVSLDELGVLGIATGFSVRTSTYLSNPTGLRLKGNRQLATWDWFATPVN